jgi:hypothetical protein
MGTDGVLHRTPDGTWERRAVLGLLPVPLYGPSWLAMRALSPELLTALGIGVVVIGWWRNGVERGAAALLVCIAGAFCMAFVYLVVVFRPIDYLIYGPAIALVSAATFALSLVMAFLPGTAPHHIGAHPWPDPRPQDGPTAQAAWTLKRRLVYLWRQGAE